MDPVRGVLHSDKAGAMTPTARACGTALNQLKQAVARADIPAAISLYNDGRACDANSGIDNAEKDGSRSKPPGISSQQVSRSHGVVVNALGSIRDRLAGHAVQVMSSEKAFLHLPLQDLVKKKLCFQQNFRVAGRFDEV